MAPQPGKCKGADTGRQGYDRAAVSQRNQTLLRGFLTWRDQATRSRGRKETRMHSIVYIVGLVVIVLAVLSFVGIN